MRMLQTMGELRAVVTGAAGGIGAAVARALAERGAVVAAVDLDAGVDDTVAKLTADGFAATAYRCDVSRWPEVSKVIERVASDLGPIDLLANVAGILRTGRVLAYDSDDWQRTFEVNTHGVFHVSRAVAAGMVPRRSGSIVTVASNAGTVPRMRMAAYGASKAAAVMFTKTLGLELAQFGIRCNIVSPGSTDTPMLRSMWPSGAELEQGPRSTIEGTPADYKVGIPLRRLATPEDIAEAVAFLLSEQARHVTMHEICVDGGAALGG